VSVPHQRLRSQLLARNPATTAHEVVAHLGAVQAQDYLGALWAVGSRMRAAIESDIERALAEREIVRCWPMRGTLHFVAAEDARWMLELLAPRVLARHRARLQRDFELDPRTLRRSRTLIERALQGGNALTRPEIYAILGKAGISTTASRGLHILFALAHEHLICFGPRRGKQPAFVLLDEWLPATKPKPRDEALSELARRYCTGHGPATAADFAWWSGLTLKEANEGLSLADVHLQDVAARGGGTPSVHLLPPFDEYTVAYKDRTAIIDPAFAKRVNAGGGILNAVVVVNGLVAGTWKRELQGDSVDINVSPFRPLSAREMRALKLESVRYARFLDRTIRT
jgi:Winged helix DNA-binding domain